VEFLDFEQFRIERATLHQPSCQQANGNEAAAWREMSNNKGQEQPEFSPPTTPAHAIFSQEHRWDLFDIYFTVINKNCPVSSGKLFGFKNLLLLPLYFY